MSLKYSSRVSVTSAGAACWHGWPSGMVRMATKQIQSGAVPQFYSPKGKPRAAVKFKGYNTVWGHSVSQDGR